MKWNQLNMVKGVKELITMNSYRINKFINFLYFYLPFFLIPSFSPFFPFIFYPKPNIYHHFQTPPHIYSRTFLSSII